MYVKLNLLFICAVLLNYGECNNCDDVYKCVSDWIAAALSPSTNFTVDTIEDVSKATNITKTDESILTDLTQFLVDRFSNLFKQGRLLEVIGNNTKIYVQTFKINDSIFDNNYKHNEYEVTTDNLDLINSDYYSNIYQNVNNILKLQYSSNEKIDTVNEKITVTPDYWLGKDLIEVNNIYTAKIDNESVIETGTDKPSTIKPCDINSQSGSDIKFQYTSHSTINIPNETTTSPGNFNNDGISKMSVETNNATLHNATIIEVKTVKNENNHANTHNQADSIKFENVTHSVVNSDKELTTTISPYLGNNNAPTTPTTNNNGNVQIEKINTQENEITDAENVFHESDNEIDIGDLVSDNLTDYLDIDYVDIYKDTTNEDVEYTQIVYTTTTTKVINLLVDEKPQDGIDTVYPWIATLFIMNADNKQFEYVCDGILVSERVVLTAARCIIKTNATVDATNILVILGKRSLQATGSNEIVLRVKYIKLHENFTSSDGKVDNDLAIIVLAERVSFNADTQPAPLGTNDTSKSLVTATTGWHATGPLQPLYLRLQTSDKCMRETNSKDIICFTLGDGETTCPSYGGVLIDRGDDNQWRVKGIATGNPMNKGVCFNKDLAFTRIGNYFEWIMRSIKETSK